MAAARVDLERFLVSVDVDLDAGPGGAEAGDGAFFAPVEGTELVSVGEEAGVYSCLLAADSRY